MIVALFTPAVASQAAVETVASDSFSRTVSQGWGTAESGGKWVLDSTNRSSVNGSQGVIQVPRGGQRTAYLPSEITGAHEATGTFTFPALPASGPGVRAGITVNRVGDSYYYAAVRVNSSGQSYLTLRAVSSPLFSSRLTFDHKVGDIAAGGQINVKTRVSGTAPALLQAKAWIVGTDEPDWQASGSSSAVPDSGAVGVRFNAAVSTPSTTVMVDSLSVVSDGPPGEPDPENVAPTASFTWTYENRALTVDGSGSTDSDGTIASYAWDFGDSATAEGAQPEPHLYTQPGDYTVTLTVTDDEGATGTSQHTVAVSPFEADPAGPANTGVPGELEASLKLVSSTPLPYPDDVLNSTKLIVKTPGAIYDGWRFNRLVQVDVPGVIFRNCSFEGLNGNPGDSALLLIPNDRDTEAVPSATVERSTMIPKYPNDSIDGVRGSNFTLRQVEISKTVDGVHIYGSSKDYNDPYAGNVLVERSWIHDLIWYDNDSHPDGTHNDGAQIRGGSNVTFLRNTFGGEIYNNTFYVSQPINRVSNISWIGNRLGGGSCTINVYDAQGPGPIEGLVAVLNEFDRGSTRTEDCATITSKRSAEVATTAYNVWDDRSEPGPVPVVGDIENGFMFDEELERWVVVPTDAAS